MIFNAMILAAPSAGPEGTPEGSRRHVQSINPIPYNLSL